MKYDEILYELSELEKLKIGSDFYVKLHSVEIVMDRLCNDYMEEKHQVELQHDNKKKIWRVETIVTFVLSLTTASLLVALFSCL